MATVRPLLDCEKRAIALLEHSKIVDPRIVRVDSEVILFTQARDKTDELRDAWTAWMNDARSEIVRLDAGFVADF